MTHIFNSFEFLFDGESSIQHGLLVYDINSKKQDDVSFGNKADISEMRLPRRVQPIHYGVNYNKDPLQFKLVFGAQDYLDRYDLESISMWLTGHQDYKWLTICQPDIRLDYRCIIRELTPISITWLPVAFEASIVCDCPYAYGDVFTETYSVTTPRDIIFRNSGTVREFIRPQLIFTPSASSGTVTWKIVNHSDGDREFKIEDIPASSVVRVDCENGIITDTVNHVNLYDGYNMNMFRLAPGDNQITITGTGTTVMSGRTLHNVSA